MNGKGHSMTAFNQIEGLNMTHTALIERLRDANTELTPADRHALLKADRTAICK
ncbi:hypothetical protein PQR64_23365 [Paraburkholderia phytofirmans]|uniref:hypothetical protein n=1 Tax=Paraburkholderia phytofirmans TaxID=261302 RepID=UPI0038B9CEC8